MIGISIVLYKTSKDALNQLSTFIKSLDQNLFRCVFFSNDSLDYIFPGIVILSENGLNFGLGAHNINIKYLATLGCDQVLTLDQDSTLDSKSILSMSALLHSFSGDIILGPTMIDYTGSPLRNQYYDFFVRDSINVENATEVNFVITSGMMLSINLWLKLGGYDQRLFIGDLDVDFCARNRMLGGKVFVIKNIFMKQNIGNGRIGYSWLSIVQHEPSRYYYYLRNKIMLVKEGRYPLIDILPVILYFFAILLTLPKNKSRFQIVRHAFKGIFDGLRSVAGPINF